MTLHRDPLPDSGQAVSDDFTVALPQWVKFVAQVGVPSALAAFLLWAGYGFVDGLAKEVKQQTITLQQHASVTDALKGSLERQQANQETMIDILRQQCVHSSKSQPERDACFARRGE